jgi:sulfoxide reductase heme-binding subunit YedZ
MTLLDLCSYLGLGAAGAIAINLLLGMLISLRYSPSRLWPHRRFDVFALHRWTAYIAVALTLAHPAVLLLLKKPRFRLVDVLWPLHSYLQPKLNTTGAAALYLVLIVLVSSLVRTSLPRRLWRNLHWLVYPAAVLLLIHSILTDPNLADGHPDLLDGGKVFLELTAIVLVGAVAFRLWMSKNGFRPTRGSGT